MSFPGGSVGEEFACNPGDSGLILGLGRFPGEGNTIYGIRACGSPMDRGDGWVTVLGVAKSRTQLSNFTFTFIYIYEKFI